MADPPPASATATVRCEHCGEAHPVTFTHCPKTGKPVATGRALVGRVFAERYRILGVLGEGGMGAVYLAEHLLIGRKVALKRLHPELASDAKAVARFQREARTAAATGHDNVVDVLDMGYGEDGAPFLVMEYLKGESLAALLRREGRLPAERAAKVVGQVLAALWAVHRRGIVHRDLKPDNVFVTKRSGRADYVKVLDFGISKVKVEEDQLALTRTGVTVGTPFYMSPEHARGVKELDGRADLYAVGVILYECLAGRVPFQGSNYHALLQAILGASPPSLRELVTETPEGLAAIVHKAIAREPKQRFQDAREMLLALVPFGAVDPGAEDSDPGSEQDPFGLLETEALRVTTSIEGKAARSEPVDVAARPPTAPSGQAPAPASPPPSGHEEVMMRDGKVRYLPVPVGPQRAVISTAIPTPSPVSASPATGPRARAATPSPRAQPTPLAPPVVTAPPSGSASAHTRSPTPAPRRDATGPVGRGVVKTAETLVKGSLILAAQEHVEQSKGKPAMARILASLPETMRESLTGLVMPVAWFPLGLYDTLLAAMERELGSGNGQLAQQSGAAAATRDLPTMHRAFMQAATPASALDRIPQLWRLYHQGGEARVESVGTGAWRIELRDVAPESFLHATAMTGFFQQLVELAGGRDVRCSLVASRAHGDERTLIALRFKD